MRHHLALPALLPLLFPLALTNAAPACSKSQSTATSAAASGAVAVQEDPSGNVYLATGNVQSTVAQASSVNAEAAVSSSGLPASSSSAALPATDTLQSSTKAGGASSAAGPATAASSKTSVVSKSAAASSAADTTPLSSAATSATSSAAKTSATSVKTSAAASASASSTGNATTSSSKMGVSWPMQEIQAAPVAKFFTDSSTVSWWFDWNKNWDQGILTVDKTSSISGQFVPMLFDTTFLADSSTLQDGFTELMGYNEPDLKSDTGVSNYIDAAVAAGLWKTQVATLRAKYPDIKIHSPVMASSQDWLSTFFSTICPSASASNAWEGCDAKPDYVSMHLYTTDVDDFKTQVKKFHETYGLPLVLSEFACHSFGGDSTCSASEASTFMAETTKWLDQQDWVIKYAWFGAVRDSEYLYGVSESNRLMDTSGALTALGKQYTNGGQTA
ncbi:hypothetical protein B9479_002533 [Cryptococcus floricola]|uniref:Asl1-like glycosyl hydrolase catalytic domain-containing protein n=1 Tax=Cryptococcus floricola TaxID=2591691 RepID=A0A5D3B3P3_9TREE|nr:hypothetical protein B9479_002533 [Cryptococcus floricola]